MAIVEPELYFEDFAVDDIYTFGSKKVTQDDIISFAEQYDPQRFHIDPQLARETVFGELVASGLHTTCVCCGMAVRELFSRTAVVAGLGFEQISHPEPVKPGDVLSGRVEVSAIEGPEPDETGGRIDFEIVGENQSKNQVLSCTLLTLVETID
jgi:acyl dehydratase